MVAGRRPRRDYARIGGYWTKPFIASAAIIRTTRALVLAAENQTALLCKNRFGLGRFPLYAQNKLHAYESGRCRSESIGRQPGPRPCVAMQEYTHSTDEQKAQAVQKLEDLIQ